MRRRLLTYTLPAALAGLILWACQRDRFGHDDPNTVEPTLTVDEAFRRSMCPATPTTLDQIICDHTANNLLQEYN